MIDLDKLIKLAEGATKGAWHSDSCGDVWTDAEKEFCPGMDRQIFRSILTTKRRPDRGDAAFVAVANPQTIKKLCEVIRVYEEGLIYIKINSSFSSVSKNPVCNRLAVEALENGKSILEGE